MPRKGQTTRKREPLVAVMATVESLPELKLAAFEILGGSLACAVIHSFREVNSTNIEALIEESITMLDDRLTPARVKELLPDAANTFIITTEECYPSIMPVRQAGFDVTLVARTRAIYSAHQKQAGGEPCLVLSIQENQTSCSLFVDGQVVNRRQDTRTLSHAAIWRNYVAADRSLTRTIEFYSPRDDTFDAELLKAFRSVWKWGKPAMAGKYGFSEIDLTSSLPTLRKLIFETDPDRTAHTIILSDWAAAYCNLSSLLASEFRVLGQDNPRRAFFQPFAGLVLFGLDELANRERPELRVDKKQILLPEVIKGDAARADLQVRNVGRGRLQAQIIASEEWVKTVPQRVECGAGGQQSVVVSADSSHLPEGISRSKLEIQWSDTFKDRTDIVLISIKVALSSGVSTATEQPKPISEPAMPLLATPPQDVELPKVEALPIIEEIALTPRVGVGVTADAPIERRAFSKLVFAGLLILLITIVLLFVSLWRPSSQSPNPTVAADARPSIAQTPSSNATPAPFETAGNAASPTQVDGQQVLLTLYANTDNVRISVDGHQSVLGKPYAAKSFPLSPGLHTVRATKEGYALWEKSLELAVGNNQSLNIYLQQAGAGEPAFQSAQIAAGYYRRAMELSERRRYDEAIAQCNSGLSVDPTNASLLKLRGQLTRAKEVLNQKGSAPPPSVNGSSPAPANTPRPQPKSSR